MRKTTGQNHMSSVHEGNCANGLSVLLSKGRRKAVEPRPESKVAVKLVAVYFQEPTDGLGVPDLARRIKGSARLAKASL